MGFTWLNKQAVRSDVGFEFHFTGRFTAKYLEDGRVTEMFVDQGPRSITIYESSLEELWCNKETPFEQRSERERIVKNVREALAFQGLTLFLMPGPEPDGRFVVR